MFLQTWRLTQTIQTQTQTQNAGQPQQESQLGFLTKAKFAIHFFENDVKNLSDVKTFLQILNCKLTYNYYTRKSLIQKGSTPKTAP